MPHITYVGNAPRVAQVDVIRIEAGQYTSRHVAEDSQLVATINGKKVTGTVPYYEKNLDSIEGPWTPLDDFEAVKALLTSFSENWKGSKEPEFREILCSDALQDYNGDWYVTLTARVAGVPFTVDVAAPYPVADVDTVVNGGPGVDAIYSFWINPASTGGTFRVQWDFGSGTETSSPIAYPPTAELIRLGMVSGMASVDDTNLTVTGEGTEGTPWVLTLRGSLGSTETTAPYIATGGLTGGGVVSSAVVAVGSGSSGEEVLDNFTSSSGYGASEAITSHVGDSGHTWALGAVHPDGTATDQADTAANLVGDNLYVLSQTGGNHGVNQWYVNSAANDPALESFVFLQLSSLMVDRAVSGSPQVAAGNPTIVYLYLAFTDHSNKLYIEVKVDPTLGTVPSTTPGATGYTGRLTISMVRVTAGTPTVLYTANTDGMRLIQYTRAASGGGLTLGHTVHLGGTLSGGYSPTGASGSPGAHLTYIPGMGGGIPSNAQMGWTACGALGVDALWGFGIRQDDPTGTGWTRSVGTATGGVTMTGVSAIVSRYIQEATGTTNSVHAVWTNATTGTFTLTKPGGSTTAAIDMATGTSDVLAKLLTVYGTGNISIGGGTGSSADPWLVEHIGTNAETDMPLITGNGAGLTGAGSATVAEVVEGSPPRPEQWSVAIVGASGGSFVLGYRQKKTASIDYGSPPEDIQAELELLSNIGADGVVVTGTGTDGDPYLVTLSDTFAGKDVRQLVCYVEDLEGSEYPVFAKTTDVASEGPWHWDHPLNWVDRSTGEFRVPATGDTIWFESGDQLRCVKYDLDQSGITAAALHIQGAFSSGAVIGLTRWNPLGYLEYRETQLKINVSTPTVCIGARGGGGSPLININTLESEVHMKIFATGAPPNGETGAVQWEGMNEGNTVEIVAGSFAAAPYVGQEAFLQTVTQHGGTVNLSRNVEVVNIYKTSGTLKMDHLQMPGGVIDIQG